MYESKTKTDTGENVCECQEQMFDAKKNQK